MKFRTGMILLGLLIVAMYFAVRLAWHGYLFTSLVLVVIGIVLAVTIIVSILRGKDW